MIQIISGDSFSELEGLYYSTVFKIEEESLITIAVWLASTGTYYMQESIDGEDWSNVPNSTVICDLMGLQVFTDNDYKLFYRIVADQEVIKAKIAI